MLVAKVLVVLRLPVVVVVEPKDESEVDEMDESTEDVTLVEPDENRLVEVVAVRTDVEDEFVDVRNATGVGQSSRSRWSEGGRLTNC